MSRRTNLSKSLQGNEKVLKPLGENSKRGGFIAKFHNGFVARAMVQFIREFVPSFRITACQTGISISEKIDLRSSVLIDIEVNIENLQSYLYVAETPEFSVGVNSNDLWNEVKSVSKQMPVSLTKLTDTDYLEIQIDDKGHNVTPCGLNGVSNEKICFPKYSKTINQSVNVSLKDFSKVCSSFKQRPAPYTLTLYQSYIEIKTKKVPGSEPCRNVLGETVIPLERLTGQEFQNTLSGIINGSIYSSLNITHPETIVEHDYENDEDYICNTDKSKNIDEEDENAICSVNLDIRMIKAVSKLSPCESGTVRFLGEKGFPMMMLFQISNLGNFRIYVETE